MGYRIRKCDLALFRDVIAIGDQLKKMPEATPEVVANIERFQEVLRRLPEATPSQTPTSTPTATPTGTLTPIDAPITLGIMVGRIQFEDTPLVRGCGSGGGAAPQVIPFVARSGRFTLVPQARHGRR